MELIFSHQALRDLKKMDKNTQRRIIKKLEYYSNQENPFSSAEKLTDASFGEWRFRIGDYRALCDIQEGKILVLKIGHRREIYR